MKKTALGLVLATFAGAAAAGDLSEPRYYESNDYSAQVFYRVDFGGSGSQAQSVGLRFDSVRAEAAGAPSLLHVRVGAQGVDKLAVNGLDLRAALVSSRQNEGGVALTGTQWAAVVLTTLLFVGVASDLDEEDDPVTGTGSGGG